MFDYLRKRVIPASPQTATASAEAVAAQNRAAAAQAKQSAMDRAQSFADDEAAAVDFILQCEFADARLKAAEYLHARPLLERVHHAMRNTDRRVAKLVQARLDKLAQQTSNDQHAQRCIADAQRLLHESALTPNQVTELDRAWSLVNAAPEMASDVAVRQSFDSVRALLRERLEAQAQLQRRVIDALADLRNMMARAESTVPTELALQLGSLEQQVALHVLSPELASLPKHLLPEFNRQLGSFKQSLQLIEQHYAAVAARRQALDVWEGAQPAVLHADAIKQQWRALPALQDDQLMAPLQQRLEALLQRITALHQADQDGAQQEKRDAQQHFSGVLGSMEKALQEGALHAAAEHDKALRAMDFKVVRPSEAQIAQLAKARTELSRLQGWAKWGGNISREELLKFAEQLPAQSLAVLELAKKVGGLREQWKSMDVSAGPAGKEIWQRFDQACTTAYAPAAEHFKQLAQQRHDNAAKAQSIIAEVTQLAGAIGADVDQAGVDWKAVAACCERSTQAWHRLGAIDRKEKKLLDTQFDAAWQALSVPLAQQRDIEVRQRESMIAEATALNPSDRNALDALRALQERWQQHAKSLQLERKAEQALWQRFRAACDMVFAKRKEASVSADNERRQHLQKKEALCSTLEAAVQGPQAALVKLLREAQDGWAKCGAVPRAAESKLEERYRQAVAALQKRLQDIKHTASASALSALSGKLALCQQAERMLVDLSAVEPSQADELKIAWQALPPSSAEFERALQTRFDTALAALQSGDRHHVSVLEKNHALLSRELLRLEMTAGIDSPPELSRERLQLQVEALQSSLKAGQKNAGHAQSAPLIALCSLPALVDAQLSERIERVLAHFGDVR